MSRRRASDYELVFRALIQLVGANNNLVRVMLDFEAASWVALRKIIQSGILAQQLTISGCHFHFTQCIVRKIKKIGGGLINLYNAKGAINHFCRKIMALALVPNSKIAEAFEFLQSVINRMAPQDAVLRGQLQQLLDYVQATWISGPLFTHKDWNNYGMFVRTNNHLEGSHSRYSKNLGSATPTFANLVDLLKDESESVPYSVAEIYSGRSGNQQSKAAAARNVELKDIWHKYQAGLIVDVTELLDELTKQLVGPDVHMIAFYADPEDVDDPQE